MSKRPLVLLSSIHLGATKQLEEAKQILQDVGFDIVIADGFDDVRSADVDAVVIVETEGFEINFLNLLSTSWRKRIARGATVPLLIVTPPDVTMESIRERFPTKSRRIHVMTRFDTESCPLSEAAAYQIYKSVQD